MELLLFLEIASLFWISRFYFFLIRCSQTGRIFFPKMNIRTEEIFHPEFLEKKRCHWFLYFIFREIQQVKFLLLSILEKKNSCYSIQFGVKKYKIFKSCKDDFFRNNMKSKNLYLSQMKFLIQIFSSIRKFGLPKIFMRTTSAEVNVRQTFSGHFFRKN